MYLQILSLSYNFPAKMGNIKTPQLELFFKKILGSIIWSGDSEMQDSKW